MIKGRLAALVRPREAPVVEEDLPREKGATDKEAGIASDALRSPSDIDHDSDAISVDAQAGIQDVEALAKVWTKTNLIVAYVT
jgi:hypothetical protein